MEGQNWPNPCSLMLAPVLQFSPFLIPPVPTIGSRASPDCQEMVGMAGNQLLEPYKV